MMSGWTDYRTKAPSSFEIRMWSRWPNANVGVVLGTRVGQWQVVAIDYDTDDAVQLETLSSILPISPMAKKGARGFTAFYLADLSVKTKRYMVQKRAILEILTGNATRQTVVAPSIHPSGHAYTWMTPQEIVPASTLPVLSESHFEELEDALSGMGWGGEEVARKDVVRLDSADPSVWRQTNNAALDNMDAWVPQLGLYKLRRTPGGYEAVPTWRASNGGQPLEARKLNLKMHKTGIKDMGTDEKFTPLNLCCRVFHWDLDTAFRWLRTQLGIEDVDGVDNVVVLPRALAEMEDGAIVDTASGEIVQDAPPDIAPAPADRELPDHLTRVPGLLGELIDYVEATARRPNRVMALGAALTVLGTAVGRRVAGPTMSGTHLFTIALGPSGVGKDVPVRAVGRLLRAGGMGQHIGPDEFMSMPAMISLLLRSPLSACAMDEFGAFLARINSRRASPFEAGLKKVMRSAWGASFETIMTPEWANRASVPIHSPALSIFGVSTPEEFFQALQGADVINGLLNRFLLLQTEVTAKDKDPAADTAEVPEALATKLKALYAEANRPQSRPSLVSGEPPPRRLEWADDTAKAVLTAMRDEVEAIRRRDEELDPLFARTVEIAIRLATIRAVGRGGKIDADDMTWGRDIAMWSARRMAEAAGEHVAANEYANYGNRVVRYLRKKGRASKRDIIAHLKGELKSKDVAELMSTLVEAGRVHAFVPLKPEKPEKGRPTTSPVYSLASG